MHRVLLDALDYIVLGIQKLLFMNRHWQIFIELLRTPCSGVEAVDSPRVQFIARATCKMLSSEP